MFFNWSAWLKLITILFSFQYQKQILCVGLQRRVYVWGVVMLLSEKKGIVWWIV